MGTVTVTGALIIIIGWFSLIEFDSYPESERQQILRKIKESPVYIILLALMPVGILINVIGELTRTGWMVITGASLILLQGFIVSLLLWKRKRWKGIFLLIVTLTLGMVMYIPLFMAR